jgi:hypothetical protein
MREFRSLFRKNFGISLSRIPLPKEKLIRLEGDYLYGSVSAKKKQYLVQSEIDSFIRSKKKDYFLIGYWGHGINSYAFYYSRIDEWSHIFFRLPYGGYYGNEEEDAIRVREFLTNYFAIEPELKRRVKSIIAVDSVGYGKYRLKLLDGRVVSLSESLQRNPDFSGKFSYLLAD